MVNKWVPILLISTTAGGALAYFSESEIKINSIVNEENDRENGIYKNDWDILRRRNVSAFGLNKTASTAGKVWKAPTTWVIGNIYQDETYFVFKDWSFLNGVKIGGPSGKQFSGGENLRSYVDGIGLKVESIKDEWKYETSTWKRTRDIKVKRVLTKNGSQFEIGKGTCLLKATNQNATSGSNLYLLIGFMKTSGGGVNKPPQEEFVSGQESFCRNYQKNTYKIGNEQIAISFDVDSGQITGKEYPILAVINDSAKWIKPIYWRTGTGVLVNAVVLGVAIKGRQETNMHRDGWKILTEKQAKQEIHKKINDGEIVERHWKNNQTVGFQLKKKDALQGDTIEDWFAGAKITFT